MSPQPVTFSADAVLFDMDGTLTDSISAVEAAWGKVADDIGQDRSYVIAATHGKRAVDNLAQFKPHIKTHEMDDAVQDFEESILFFADAYNSHGPGSLGATPVDTPMTYTPISGSQTPDLAMTPGSSAPPSRHNSFTGPRRPSFGTRLNNMLQMSSIPQRDDRITIVDDAIEEEDSRSEEEILKEKQKGLSPWQIEATAVDRAVQILPGVKKMMDSIPKGRYAVATSGAKTYAYGCMTRVGITPPAVTITADDKRLKNGKPFPDPFLLAAKELGFDAKRCVVFEDSPSGIRAGVASGATVIAVCTSHERSKIENAGAHYIVDNMEHVSCEVQPDGRLKFSVRL